MKVMKKTVFAMALLAGLSAFAAEETVYDGPGLIDAVGRLKQATDVIYLATGFYDVSSSVMSYENNAYYHLVPVKAKLVGLGASPRDVVVYGDGMHVVFYCSQASLQNLTVSNGCRQATWTGHGGGVCSYNSVHSNVVVTCCSNLATGNSQGGGVSGGTWYDSLFCSNRTDGASGGGVYGGTYFGCVISNNYAISNGGGAHGVARMVDCDVVDNFAEQNGGGLNLNGACSITNVHVYGNSAKKNGGGIWAQAIADIKIHNCIISNNCVTSDFADANGGGAYLGTSDLTQVSDSKFLFNRLGGTGNKVNVYGAGVYGGTLTNSLIAGNAIVDCSATGNKRGAGAYASTLLDCVVRDNFGFGANGIAMTTGKAYGCTFTNNVPSSNSSYGLLSLSAIEGCVISDPCSEINPVRCSFIGYTNGYYLAEGANVYASGSYGGLSYLVASSGFCATNCLFAYNTTKTAVFDRNNKNGTYELVNCTVASNVVNRMFYAGNKAEYAIRAVNTIFCGNTATSDGLLQNMFCDETDNRYTLDHCAVGSTPARGSAQPIYSEVSVLNTDDPKFVGVGEHPFDLQRKSGLRGIGSVMEWMSGATDIRGEGYPRMADGKVDIGCYQCRIVPTGMFVIIQ